MALASNAIGRAVARAPFTPHPHGVLAGCHPTNLIHFYRIIAEAIGIKPDDILAITSTNLHSAAARKRGLGGNL
jgi:hypothetical protein